MAFNVNHGLIPNESETILPNGEKVSIPKQSPKRINLGFTRGNIPELTSHKRSSKKLFEVSDDLKYDYTVVDDAYVCIDKIHTTQKHLVVAAEINDLPVFELGIEVLAENEIVESIVLPDAIQKIGACAFKLCTRLTSIRFPLSLATYSASWLQHCDKLQELVLPGALTKITRMVFDHPNLTHLTIGSEVSEIEPGAFEKTNLESFELDPDNPFLDTDDVAFYSKGYETMLALAKPVSSYTVQNGCKVIGRKAAKGQATLKEIQFPDTLFEIEGYAFAHTVLVDITLPESVRILRERCFYHCEDLESVTLNAGLEVIEERAFSDTALRAIELPASIQFIGAHLAENSNVIHSGSDCTYSISPQSDRYLFDGEGGVYEHSSDGLRFVQLVDSECRAYKVLSGTIEIASYSFAFHDKVEQVDIPVGVRSVGDCAFRICRNLRRVSLPDGLISIGKEAFLDSRLEALSIPASLESIGADAFVCSGAHHMSEERTLAHIEVDHSNVHFYVESGILCQRGESGDRALMFTDSIPNVEIPREVSSVAPYAFNNARNVKSVVIHPSLKLIGTCGFTMWSKVRMLDITVLEPEEGRTHFVLEYPNLDRVRHDIAISLGGSSWVNVPEIYRHYDNCLANAHDYNHGDGISCYEQCWRILARLKDPIFLTPVNESMLTRVLALNLLEICSDIARNDDRNAFNDLADFDLLTADNIEDVIMAVQRTQDASATAHLLEMKRELFGQRTIDFSL